MSNILVPVDFSVTSENALRYAAEIASRINATITILYVYFLGDSPTFHAPEPLFSKLDAEKLAQANTDFQRFTKKFAHYRYVGTEQNLRFMTVAKRGIATNVIPEFANDNNFELVVMGTTGASNMVEKIIGSITYQVLPQIAAPMLIVPLKAVFQDFSHIVFACSLKDDVDSIKELQDFADLFGSKLTCLHISRSREEAILDEIRIEEIEEKLMFTPVNRIDFKLKSNESVTKGILEYLNDTPDTDIIAVLPEERNFVANIFHKSITKNLAYHSKTPVLVLRK